MCKPKSWDVLTEIAEHPGDSLSKTTEETPILTEEQHCSRVGVGGSWLCCFFGPYAMEEERDERGERKEKGGAQHVQWYGVADFCPYKRISKF